jgi:circadian clock protein KaiC
MLANAKSCFKDFTDIDELISDRKLIIDGEDPTTILRSSEAGTGSQYEFGKVVSDIESIIVSTGAKRLVIDSLSVMDLLITDPSVYRRSMLALVSNLRRLGVTTLLTAEMPTPERSKLAFKEEFFIFDGIIIMYAKGEEEKRMLAMEVIKMRGSKHSFLTTPYEMTQSGFNIVSADDIS